MLFMKPEAQNKIKNVNSYYIYSIFIKIFIASGLLSIISCNKFELNPVQIKNSDSPTNLNAKNIEELLSKESISDDTVTFLFTGDSQRFYDRLDDLVEKANQYTNIDFLLLDGDISDFGLLQEFLWIHERLEKLNIPYISVIGNHDLTSRGSDVYTEMFGPKNFSFTYKKIKFLCHDDNSREYNFSGVVPHIDWLTEQLNDTTADWFVGASHIPPWSTDFDPNLVNDYMNLFGSHSEFILSLHGHHVDPSERYYNNDAVLYINSSGVQKTECYIIKLIHGTIIKELITY